MECSWCEKLTDDPSGICRDCAKEMASAGYAPQRIVVREKMRPVNERLSTIANLSRVERDRKLHQALTVNRV
jgi:hypothetical protein